MKAKAQYIINQNTRFNYLYYKIHSKMFKKNCQISIKYRYITKENVDKEVKNFPLCMQYFQYI